MLNLPILRWGQPYTSLEQDTVKHFITGETLAKVSQANTGLLGRDMRQARRAREELIGIPIGELIEMMKTAGDLYLNGTLPMGDGEQTPDDFARQQSQPGGGTLFAAVEQHLQTETDTEERARTHRLGDHLGETALA